MAKNKIVDISEVVSRVPTWEIIKGQLYSEFIFKDFEESFLFMTKVAVVAEQMNHHPTWTNTYNKVNITLWTHDDNALTNLDIELAEQIDKIVAEM
jgi:4a-hydroxytetrahydrobiopterin dehydratase